MRVLLSHSLQQLIIETIGQLSNYSQPHAPGALLKAVCAVACVREILRYLMICYVVFMCVCVYVCVCCWMGGLRIAPFVLIASQAFCCAEILDIHSSLSLEQQLQQKHGGGFELSTWSNLPQGSGLGSFISAFVSRHIPSIDFQAPAASSAG